VQSKGVLYSRSVELLSQHCSPQHAFLRGQGGEEHGAHVRIISWLFRTKPARLKHAVSSHPRLKKPSRTVLMSPCRSYCEGTDIDAF